MARPSASPVPRELQSLLLQGCVACSCQDSTNSDKTQTRQRPEWPRQWQAEAAAKGRCKTTFFYLAALSRMKLFFEFSDPPVGQRPLGWLAACYCNMNFLLFVFFPFFSSFSFLFGLFVFLFCFF